MKIAMMTNNYKPFVGGVPVSVERLSEGLRDLGHDVVIFAPAYEDVTAQEGEVRVSSFKIGSMPCMALPNVWDSTIEKEFRKQKFDVIHVHHPMLMGRKAWYLSKKYNTPLCFTYHTRYEQYLHYLKPFSWLLSEEGQEQSGKKYLTDFISKQAVPEYLHGFLKHCSHVFIPTESMMTYITEVCKYEKENVSVLPTGLADTNFVTKEDACKQEHIRKYYEAEEMPLFCTVSRMAREKNIPFLLQALTEFKKEWGSSFKMLMIGDGPDKEYYQSLCRTLGLEKNVIFTGNLPNADLHTYYKASDLFLFASKSETQGIVILEAMAGGTPVIAVDATGVSDIVQNGINGYTVSENSTEFVKRMQELLQNRERLQCISAQAMRTAGQFSKKAMAEEAAYIYTQVVADKKTEPLQSKDTYLPKYSPIC